MKHLFVPYEIALKLKEKGFNEPCFCYWFTTKGQTPQLSENDIHFNGYKNYSDSNTIAPLYQQVIDWFREKHDIHINSTPYYNPYRIEGLYYEDSVSTKENSYEALMVNAVARISNNLSGGPKVYHLHKLYYEALTAAIEEALKLI